MGTKTPVRNPRKSTADLLFWPETNVADSPPPASRSSHRSHQPSDGIGKVVFGGQITDEEAKDLLKRNPCSDHKMKEMTGSGIFTETHGDFESDAETPISNKKTGVRTFQNGSAGTSQISFGAEESVTPKKAITVPEVAKQRELSGTFDRESESMPKQISHAKCRELNGNDIFAPAPELLPRSVPRRTLDFSGGLPSPADANGGSSLTPCEEAMIKTARKINHKKFSELTGTNIFREEGVPSSVEKVPSVSKLREMVGSDIFADGKVEARDYHGGVRKPPGGDSSVTLV